MAASRIPWYDRGRPTAPRGWYPCLAPCVGHGGRGRAFHKTNVWKKLLSLVRRTTPSIHLSSGEAVLDLHGLCKRLTCMDPSYGHRGRTHRTIVRRWCCCSSGWLHHRKPYIPRVALLMGSTLMAQFKALAYYTRNASDC